MQTHCNEPKYEYAGFWVRLAAYVIDMIIVSAVLLVVRLILLGVTAALSGTFLDGGILFHYTLADIILYLLQVVYFILFTYYTGTTLGKRALNLRVIKADEEENQTLLNVIYRETIGRFLCGFLVGIGYIIAGIDKEKRGLHDILCDTRVIYAKKVKVYPVYQKGYVNEGVNPAAEQEVQDLVPKMAEETTMPGQQPPYEYSYMEEKHQVYGRKTPEEIQEEWKQILNPQKEEIITPCEEENIEGNS